MSKFLRFCMAFLGLDVLFDWITSSRGQNSIKNFFLDLGKVLLSVILLHILGILVLGVYTDNKFFSEYVTFIRSWDSIKPSEYVIGLAVLVAVGAFAMMLMITALIAFFLAIVFAIMIPLTIWQWGKSKWNQIYGKPTNNEDENDENENEDECSTCEEAR